MIVRVGESVYDVVIVWEKVGVEVGEEVSVGVDVTVFEHDFESVGVIVGVAE